MTSFASGHLARRRWLVVLPTVVPTIASLAAPVGSVAMSQTSQGVVVRVDSARVPKRLTSDPRSAALSAAPLATNGDSAGDSRIVSFAFGHSEPVLRCTVLRACVVELESGEALVDEPISGDQERWIIARARTGAGGASTLVIVKPKACDISTNLVLSTDRRIYDLDLESPACMGTATNPKQSYTRHIRFEYPDDRSKISVLGGESDGGDGVGTGTPRRESGALPVQDSTVPDSFAFNRNYRVVRERRGPFGLFGRKPVDFPWVPTAICDDGAHVYITMPAQARQHAAPVLYAVEDDGSRTMMNFTTRDSVIVTDRVFRRGVFVLASGEREHWLEFENRSWGKVAPSTARH
jgi:type IV secretory pathway VirB9-like protein